MKVMDEVAKPYVQLVLALGEHDADYVDAYYGPKEWSSQVTPLSLEEIRSQANYLFHQLDAITPEVPMEQARHRFLVKQIQSMIARVDMLSGKSLSFNEETSRCYDAISPKFTEAHYRELINQLDALVPGDGDLNQRLDDYRNGFVIPSEKLDEVFTAAINEARKRTNNFITLPENESFVVEYVKDKPWSGYNWYKGDFHSLIQVNTDLPIFIDRAVDLACHEGYPGHHVFNALLEQHMVLENNWVEFSIYPLFSPISLIAEGSANYGIDVCFPAEERVQFERDILFPLAGLAPETADTYYQIQAVLAKLKYAGNEAARAYLDGDMEREAVIEWLMTYSQMSRERAVQRLKFIDKYRGYVINYNLGQDMVGDWIERNGGTADQTEKRWSLFRDLLTTPRVPSELK